jgi:hypothetical protein
MNRGLPSKFAIAFLVALALALALLPVHVKAQSLRQITSSRNTKPVATPVGTPMGVQQSEIDSAVDEDSGDIGLDSSGVGGKTQTDRTIAPGPGQGALRGQRLRCGIAQRRH